MELHFNVIVQLVLVFAVTEADQWTRFSRLKTLDGKVCQDEEVAFSKENVYDITFCLRRCETSLDCTSIFYVQHSQLCTGCTIKYDNTNYPEGHLSGSIYYRLEKCLEGWFEIKASCYYITKATTRTEGMKECESLNAHPVILETMEETTNLKLKLNSMTFPDEFIGFYTAYTDNTKEGTWVVHGTLTELTFSDWAAEEPNGGTDENCLELLRSANWRWNDTPCQYANQRKTICEREG